MKLRLLRRLPRPLRWLVNGLLIGFLLLCGLEVLYRYQVFDTYRREMNYLNKDKAVTNPEETMLVMGDSFSACDGCYVDELRKLFPTWNIVNSAVPGTTVKQANVMAPRRFETVQPTVFLYQVYVGNDLFDLRYPVSFSKAGVFRSLYWMLANRFRSLSWLNYAMGQFKAAPTAGVNDGKLPAEDFSVERYTAREKLYLQAEPTVIEKSVLLEGARKADFDDYMPELQELLDYCEDGKCRVWLLVLPHCAQVGADYMANMEAIGAKFEQPELVRRDVYPFYQQMAARLGKRKNLIMINPLPILRQAEQKGEQMFYANDPHLNPAGHREVAQFIHTFAPWIERQVKQFTIDGYK